MAESFTLDKLAKLSADCRGGASTRSKNDPVGLLGDSHKKFFSLPSPVPFLATAVRRAVAAREFGPQWPSAVEFFTTTHNDVLRTHLESHYRMDARSNLAMRRYLELPNPLPKCLSDVTKLMVDTD